MESGAGREIYEICEMQGRRPGPGLQAAGTRDLSGFSAFETGFSFLQRNAPEEKASVGPWLLALFIFVVCGSGKCLEALLVWNDVVTIQW